VVQAMGHSLVVSATDMPVTGTTPGATIRLGWNADDAQLLAVSGSTTGGENGGNA